MDSLQADSQRARAELEHLKALVRALLGTLDGYYVEGWCVAIRDLREAVRDVPDHG